MIFVLLFLVGCTSIVQQDTVPETNSGSEIIHVPVEEIVQDIPETTIVIQNNNLNDRGIYVVLEDVHIETLDQIPHLFIRVRAEDRITDIKKSIDKGNFPLRDPNVWSGILFTKPGGLFSLFPCTLEREETSWYNTYCIPLASLSEDIYGNSLFFIYTAEEQNHVLRKNTLTTIDDFAYTYIFKFTLNTE